MSICRPIYSYRPLYLSGASNYYVTIFCIKGVVLKSIDNFKDLSVIRSAATSHAGHYQTHYQEVITKAAQISAPIRRIFRSRANELL